VAKPLLLRLFGSKVCRWRVVGSWCLGKPKGQATERRGEGASSCDFSGQEATGFFSRGVRVVGQSSPKDIACGMFVCLCAMTAALAFEYRLADAILA
jgi:hypothetical protein